MYITDPYNGFIPLVFPLAGDAYNLRNNWHIRRHGKGFPWTHRYEKGYRAHDGVDIYEEVGVPVYACVKGKVIAPPYKDFPLKRYGNSVWLRSNAGDDSEGYMFLCAHLDKVNVELGQQVNINTQIGTIGQTGATKGTKPHLHFEIHYPDKYYYNCNKCQPHKERQKAINPYPSLSKAQKRAFTL